MNIFRQLETVTRLQLSTLRQRLWTSLVIVVGMAAVVGVLLSMLSFSTGILLSFQNAAKPDRAIVLPQGVQGEMGSNVPREWLAAISDAPGIRRDMDGKPIVSAEILTTTPAIKKDDGLEAAVYLRGVGPKFMALRPELHLVSGRLFATGRHEMIIGISGQERYRGLELNDRVTLADGDWTIVGSFESGDDVIQGELLADSDTMMSSVRRNAYNSVIVRLESPATFDAFKNAVTKNPALSASADRHTDYYARTAQGPTTFFAAFAYFVGGVMAIGALFGAVNTMYAAVSARSREIATLRAIGFAGTPLAIAVLLEAVLLCAVGALIGAAIAWFLFNGMIHSMGPNVFHLSVTPGMILLGLVWAIAIAFAGGLLPALRAARLPVTTALRAA
jgi:putative ABC transport system permease protein